MLGGLQERAMKMGVSKENLDGWQVCVAFVCMHAQNSTNLY